MRGAAALSILLAACSGSDVPDGVATANQIERLSTPRQKKADPLASVRLQPLAANDLALEGLAGPGCGFRRGGRTLLRVVGSDAVVRIGGELRHLIHSAPVGPTGGFFEDRQLSVSVGRTGEAAGSAASAGIWPARLAVTNRRTGTGYELRGEWACGG